MNRAREYSQVAYEMLVRENDHFRKEIKRLKEDGELETAIQGVRIAVYENAPKAGKVAVLENLADVVLGRRP